MTIRYELYIIFSGDFMELRSAKINISAAGGSAGAGSKTCKVTLPTAWLSAMGLGEVHREVILSFDGEQITIFPAPDMEEYARKKRAMGHQVLSLRYYDDNQLCTLIYVDLTDRTVQARNDTTDWVKTAFGKKTLPTWDDFESFLKERCMPEGRAGLQGYLADIGLDAYDPLEIVKKTKGRMAEDRQWLEIEEMGP